MTASLNVALLLVRAVAGLTLAAHGSQKFFGWFEGPGLAKFSGGLQKQGLKPAGLWTALVVLGEVGGGLSLAFGLLTPLGAAGGLGAMFMAILKAHWKNGFWNSKRGVEFPLQLLTMAVAVGIAGPGDYSLDKLLGVNLPVTVFLALAAAAIVVDLIGLGMSRTPASATAPAAPAAPTTQTPVPTQTPGSAPTR
jgi:putative oxidoreductase